VYYMKRSNEEEAISAINKALKIIKFVEEKIE
jgi:hypothetical protein